jgi:two-component system LytT family sensor kinase
LLLVISILIIPIIIAIYLGISLSNANKQIAKLKINNDDLSDRNQRLNRENSQLMADNAILEAENLKFQLHPHTLGNVVSTLDGLVANLHRGTAALTNTINYILYSGKSHMVSVEDEINFIHKFVDMHNSFDSEIIQVKIDKSEVDTNSPNFKSVCIPHLISAYLIENAYKHGNKSHPDFLNIVLKLNSSYFEMQVNNKLKPKVSSERPGGIGLKNMQKRLELLNGGKFELKNSCNEETYFTTLKIHF